MNDKRYTIIDLGSNSFHMLTVTKSPDGFSVFSKKKQKVRLASGLDAKKNLTPEIIKTALHCLQSFRDELDKLAPKKILITATAALRLANNKQLFINQAERVLNLPISLISGIEEAETIYRGVAFTEKCKQQLLVVDIGGASTELIIGKGNKVLKAESLNMGCVTWLNNAFSDNKLNKSNFDQAINDAKLILNTHIKEYKTLTWSLCMGASGTIQAVDEINGQQQLSINITLELLNNIKQQCIKSKTIDALEVNGLKPSRKPVFASGLAILIALFESLEISEILPAKGALREGLISRIFED